jgi:hypothetical protein
VPTYVLTSILILRKAGRPDEGRGARDEGRGKTDELFVGSGVLAGVVCIIAAFIAVDPFAVLDMKSFIASLVSQNGSFGYSGLTHHFAYSLTEGISLPLAFLGLAGIIVLATKGDRGKIFVSFPVVYYLVIVFRGQEFARYVLPLVPFFAVGAAYLIFEAVPHVVKTSLARRVITAAAVLMILPTAVKSVKADMVFASKDTRITAAEWIKNNLPAGTKIACDSTVFRPALRQPYSQLEDKAKFALAQEGLGALKSKKMELMMKAASKDDKGYPLYFMFEDPAAQGQFLDTIPAILFDLAALKARGIEYVVVNGQETNRAKEAFLSDMRGGAARVADFSPYPDGEFRLTNDKIDATCIPMAGRELFARNTAGPSLRIYRIKSK